MGPPWCSGSMLGSQLRDPGFDPQEVKMYGQSPFIPCPCPPSGEWVLGVKWVLCSAFLGGGLAPTMAGN